METKQVDVGKAIAYGWSEVKKNFWYFVGLAVIVIVIESIGSGPKEHRTYFNVLGLFLGAWMACGFTTIVLDYYGGTKREITDVFTQVKDFWRVLGANILVGFIVLVGFIFLIVPGIYLGLRFIFTIPLIIDKNLGIGEAMERSSEMTKGIKMELFVFALTVIGVLLLGVICLGVGIFVAMPVVWLAYIYIYKTMQNIQPAANVQPVIKTATPAQ
ncbi:MAG: DUF975 family protein [Patescibacteria group bacterium]|jgi:uncharacterized membrane protein